MSPYLGPDEDGEPLTADRLRKRGLRREREGQIERRFGRGDGETLLRSALQDLVDAFLADRVGQSDLFARAHRLGKQLSDGDCTYSYDSEKLSYEIRCPVHALHRPVAHSVGWTVLTECSICGAQAFGCDHEHGKRYDEGICRMNVTNIVGFDHLALTANPDFLYTWHQPQTIDARVLLDEGRIDTIGQELFCRHCASCPGLAGPSDGDLDPIAKWNAIVAERRSKSS